MSVVGNLEDLSPGDLVQALALLAKSGKLRLERGDEEGLLVFRNGRIIYAASSSVRENFGGLLVSSNLISESQLREALERQGSSAEEKRLGSVLIEMGLLTGHQVEETIREQFSRIVSEFIHWTSGRFEFDSLQLADHGEVELDARDFLVPGGLESTYVLLDAARQADEQSPGSERQAGDPAFDPQLGEGGDAADRSGEGGAESLEPLLDELTAPIIGGETVHRLLDIAGRTMGRCVLFSAHRYEFQASGHFGLESADGDSPRELTGLRIPRAEPSVLTRAVDKRGPVLASLPVTDWDRKILEALGDPPEGKSVAVPFVVGDEVLLVLYGDRLPADLSTGWLEQLCGELQGVAEAIEVPPDAAHLEGVGRSSDEL